MSNVTITGEMIVKQARSYLGCPFRHQGRNRSGLDCIGLVICVIQDLGLYKEIPNPDYGKIFSAKTLHRFLDELLDSVKIGDIRIGDILLFNPRSNYNYRGVSARHVGLVSNCRYNGYFNVIHASSPDKKVVEHIMDGEIKGRISGAYRYRGIG